MTYNIIMSVNFIIKQGLFINILFIFVPFSFVGMGFGKKMKDTAGMLRNYEGKEWVQRFEDQ